VKNLIGTSGLSIKFNEETSELIFYGDVESVKPDVRELKDMSDVLFDKSAKSPNEVYYMYRDVYRKEDRGLIREYNLRYDITVIPPAMLGREFVKTLGHYHPEISGTGLTYPEVYEVLNGKAHYLLQRVEKERVLDVVLIAASEGDKVLVPPNYGHITINPFDVPLVMSNWVCPGFSSIYEPIGGKRGGAYFEIDEINNFVPNGYYGKIPGLKEVGAWDVEEFGLVKNTPMYTSFLSNPERFRFLAHPEDYEEIFKMVLSDWFF